jgi:molybdopterin-synthase adenylyltransferase
VELVWPAGMRSQVASELLAAAPGEAGGALLAYVDGDPNDPRFLVVDFRPATADDEVESSEFGLEIDPNFWVKLAKPARRRSQSILPIHTHPGDVRQPTFSGRDLHGEEALQPVLERLTGRPAAAVVMGEFRETVGRFGRDGVRLTGPSREVGIGPRQRAERPLEDEAFARHVAAFGAEGQARLKALTVAVVGASGTGSHVCQQLFRLGVGTVVVVDPDVVERVNLNRVVTAFAEDALAKRPKVVVAENYASRLGLASNVLAIRGDVRDQAVHRHLETVDGIFGCTDTIASRAILNRVAVQRFIPYFDCGTEISAGGDLRAYGRLRVVLAGGPCLFCAGAIDPEGLRVELLKPEERALEAARGYIRDGVAGAPAVVSLNGVVASLAVTSFLRWAVGQSSIEGGSWIYRSYASDVRKESVARDPDCPVCSIGARLGRADLEVRL